MRGIVRRSLVLVASNAIVSLRVAQDVLEGFKAQGPGYQTRMNSVLRAYRDAAA